jgi:hypothetical protein
MRLDNKKTKDQLSVSRRFRQPADSRATARWPVSVGSFGLHANEGQLDRCPVSHSIPATNKAIQASLRRGGIFYASLRASRALETSAPSFSQTPGALYAQK